MKKLLTLTLCLLFVLTALFTAGCKEKEYVPEGPTDVNYGEVAYTAYEDGTALTFDYLDCFVRTSDEDTSFVANTPDEKGVLSYIFFDSFRDYEKTYETYLIPTRKYAEIAAYSEEEAKNYLEIALGMVASQGAKYTTDDFKLEKYDNYVYLFMEVTAEYEKTGEIQKMWIAKYVVENERVYTLQAFVPASCVTKYGPVFKNVAFDIENALTAGATNQ
ncbi:MAG: hypothetical protein J5772_08135 [Clostridia bacterium]|nr:hypothetical protein [Clostridia bacterium]